MKNKEIIEKRLNELSQLKEGWLWGNGQPLPEKGVLWVKSVLEQYPEDIASPYLYPTEEGNLLIEWKSKYFSPSLEINLSNHKAYWNNCSNKNKEEEIYYDFNIQSNIDNFFIVLRYTFLMEKKIEKDKSKDEYDIKPFSWMNEEVKNHLEKTLSPECMQKLDESARSHFRGLKIMTDSIKKAIKRIL